MPEPNTFDPQAVIAPTPAPRMGQPNTADVNYLGRYQSQMGEMLAPYQEMASRISSPYATMRPDSWLATQHPKAAGVLDNMFLTGAMTPGPQGPEGAGGGISRAFQGLVGAQQYRRQQAVMQALLPYQMLEPRLKAMDVMAQIGERESEIPYRRAMEQKAAAQSELYMSNIGAQMTAATNRQTEAAMDAKMAWGVVKPVDPKNPTQEEYSKFMDTLEGFRQKRGGGIGGSETERMVTAEDQERVAKGLPPYTAQERNERIVNYSGRMAGARTGGSEAARAPYVDFNQERQSAIQEFNAQTQRSFQTSGIKPMTQSEWMKNPVGSQGQMIITGITPSNDERAYKEYLAGRQKDIDKFNAGVAGDRKKLNDNLKAYENDARARSQGIGFDEYVQRMTNPDSTPAAPSTGWQPKR